MQLKNYLVKFSERVTRGSLDRIFGNGKRALGAIRRILTCIKIKYFNSFRDWKEIIIKLKQKELQNGMKLEMIGKSITKRISRLLFDSIVGDNRIRRMFNKLIKNYQDIERFALHKFWARVEKIRTIKKINSAFFVFKLLKEFAKKTICERFKYWKNLEYLRKRRILRKAVGKMIHTMSISYESAFWKWKFILTTAGNQINPKHALLFKRLFSVSSNYQRRLEQFALFKIVLKYKSHPMTGKLSLPKALAKIIKSPRDSESISRNSDSRPLSSMSIEYKKEEYPSSISTLAPWSMVKEETQVINQLGALEIVFLQFRKK